MKNFLSIFLALILLFSFNINAFARTTESLDLTVDENGLITGNISEEEKNEAVNDVLNNFKEFVGLVYALALVTMAIYFILYFSKIGASGTNAVQRSRAMSGILYSGIALAGLGSIGLLAGIIYFLFV